MGDAGEARAAAGAVRGGHGVRGVRGAGQLLRVAGEPAGRAVPGRAVCRAVRAGQRTSERAAELAGGGAGAADVRRGVGRRGEAAGGLRPAVEGGAGGRAGRAAVCEEHAAGVPGAVDRAPGTGDDLSDEPGAGEAAGEVSDQERRETEAEGGA